MRIESRIHLCLKYIESGQNLLHGSVASFAGGLCLESGLRVFAGVQSHRGVVLEMGDPGSVRIHADGTVLIVGGATARAVLHRLQAWVVHGHRFTTATSAAGNGDRRCVLDLYHQHCIDACYQMLFLVIKSKQLSQRRGTARRPMSVEISSTATQLYEKSRVKRLAVDE